MIQQLVIKIAMLSKSIGAGGAFSRFRSKIRIQEIKLSLQVLIRIALTAHTMLNYNIRAQKERAQKKAEAAGGRHCIPHRWKSLRYSVEEPRGFIISNLSSSVPSLPPCRTKNEVL